MSKPCAHDSRPLYEKLIEPLRARARELGYALAVHGTLKRDIDLVAIPWTADAVEAKELAEALRLVALDVHGAAFLAGVEVDDPYHVEGCLDLKNHGRRTWCYHLGGGPYIDLSVMPRTSEADPKTRDALEAKVRMLEAMLLKDDATLGALRWAVGIMAPVVQAARELSIETLKKSGAIEAAMVVLLNKVSVFCKGVPGTGEIEIGADNEPRCAACKRKDYPLEKHRCSAAPLPGETCADTVIGDADKERCGISLPCPLHGMKGAP